MPENKKLNDNWQHRPDPTAPLEQIRVPQGGAVVSLHSYSTGSAHAAASRSVGGLPDSDGMNNITQIRPTIQPILAEFFADRLAGKTGVRRARIERVQRRLNEYLEQEGERVLTTGGRVILAAARELDPVGAFSRTMHADDLVFALYHFVGEEWLDADPLDRLAQLRETEYLVGRLIHLRLIDERELSCPLLDLRYRLDSGRDKLRRQKREAAGR